MRNRTKLTVTLVSLIALMAAIALTSGDAEARKYSRNDRLWLGVMTASVDYDLIEEKDLDVKYGVYVIKVIKGSPAEDAGLQKGDVIISLDGMKITDNAELTDALTQFDEGQKVDLVVLRDGKETTVNVELEEADDDYAFSSTFGPAHTITINSDRGYLGVRLDDLNPQLGEFFGIEKGRGALIEEVLEESPAETAGLKAGDVIIAIDKYSIRDVDDVTDEIRDFDPGDKVTLTIIRDRKEMNVEVELGEHEFERSWFGYGDWNVVRGLDGLKGLEALEGLKALKDLDIDIDVPDAPNAPEAWVYPRFHHSSDFDREELQREMEEVRRQMQELKKELEEIRDQLD